MKQYLEERAQKIDMNILKHMNPDDPRGQRFDRVTVEYGNLEIEMMGVAHTVETLPRHRAKIEAVIKNTDLLILESAQEAKDSSLARGKGNGAVSPDGMFFLEVERMVRKYGKGLVTTDPFYGDGVQEEEHRDVMEEGEKLVQNTRRFIGIAGATASVAGGGLTIASTIEKAAQGKSDPNENNTTISRRNFLKLSAAGAGVLLSHKIAGATAEAQNYGKSDSGEPMSDYQLNDYRDVVISEGIDMMSRSFMKKKKVSLLFGAHHIKGIRYYLDHPDIRRAKLALYKPFRQLSEPKLRAYHFELDKQVNKNEAQKGNFGEWKKDVDVLIKTPQ